MGILDDLKSVANVLQEAGKIKELQQLLNAQKELLEMQEKLRLRDEEIRNLKEKLKIKSDLFYENEAYWIKKKDGSKEGPFCPGCWDKNKEISHLNRILYTQLWRCPVCNASFTLH